MPPSNQSTPLSPPAAEPIALEGISVTPEVVTKRKFSWSSLAGRANTVSGIVSMLVVLTLCGGVTGYLIAGSRAKPAAAPTKTATQALSTQDLAKLSDVSAGLGNAGQTLSVQSAALFKQKVDVGGDLSIGGHLNANGPVTLSQLNITGTTALTGLNVGSNLNVGGTTNIARGANVTGLLSVNGGLNVSGASSLNSLTATSISTRTISISGPLTIGHLSSQGPSPVASAGSAIGSGGTTSVSGTDTAGTLDINIGGATSGGILASVTFRAPYGTIPHITLSPLTGAAASTPVYIVRSVTGFTVRTDTPATPGTTLAYDFIVVQ